VGDDRAHAARLGKRQRLAVVGLAVLGIEPVRMGGDIAEQMQRMGREPGVRRRIFERAVGHALGLVEPAEQQSGTPEPMVVPAVTVDESLRCVVLEELLALPEPGQRFARIAELREDPGGGGDRMGKGEDDIPRPIRGDSGFDQ
jgi:hypothetical protein